MYSPPGRQAHRKSRPISQEAAIARPSSKLTAFLLFAVLLASAIASAYEIPLADDSVRNAYFLGQNNDSTTAGFFDAYTKNFPVPPSGPSISRIELLTPYAQVVQVSQTKTIGYSAQDAAQDYQNRGDTILVYVRIDFTATYGYSQAIAAANDAGEKQGVQYQPEDFWRDFGFHLSQPATQPDSTDTPANPVRIESREVHASPIYVEGTPLYALAGAELRFIYDATKISSSPVSFEVVPPAGQPTVATFDLSVLR